MNNLRFGFFPEPLAGDLVSLVRRARYADAAGLDLIGIQDHPYQRRFVDTFALLAHLAAVTERIALFPDVASLPLRGPAIIAKQAATIDLLSGGRFELGLGAGGFWEAIAAMGGPRRSPGEALASVDDAITVIRALWSGERGLRTQGAHYRLAGVHGGPAPAHDIGIWVGGAGPLMMRLIGQRADGWVPSLAFVPESALGEKSAILDEAAAAAGRDPRSIRRICNVGGQITGVVQESPSSIIGPPQHWADTLLRLASEHRMDTFVMSPSGDVDRQLARFAEEVVPAVRAAG